MIGYGSVIETEEVDIGQEEFRAEKVVDRDQGREGELVEPNVEKPDKVAQKPDDVVEQTQPSVAQGAVEDHADTQSAQAESGERRTIVKQDQVTSQDWPGPDHRSGG